MTEKTQTMQRNASIIQEGPESVQRCTQRGTEIHAGMHPTYETEQVPRRVDGLSKGTAIG